MKVEFKPLDQLEDRIRKAVEAVRKLEDENRSLRQKVGDLEGRLRTEEESSRELRSLRDSHAKAQKDLEDLQRERDEFRGRVESILQNLERLNLE